MKRLIMLIHYMFVHYFISIPLYGMYMIVGGLKCIYFPILLQSEIIYVYTFYFDHNYR